MFAILWHLVKEIFELIRVLWMLLWTGGKDD